MFCYKYMKYKLLIRWLSFKWIFKVNLGDEVLYKGKKYVVCDGVRSNQWRLGGLNNDDYNESWVNRKECKKVKSVKNFLHSYDTGMNFYTMSWLGIWEHEGIKPWMKRLDIW